MSQALAKLSPWVQQDLVPALEGVLERARAGEITDYIAVYIETVGTGQGFSRCYRNSRRAELIGLLEILKQKIIDEECEVV